MSTPPSTSAYTRRGMGSTVHGCIARYDDEMDRLRSRAIALGREPAEVASVTWLGYDAPLGWWTWRSATRPSPDRRCCSASPTASGARGRIGSTSSHWATYGSTTTALSLIKREHRIDDAVFFGSPGLATNDLAELGLPPGHVYLLEAKGDPVADLGYFGNDPNWLQQIVILSTGPSHVGIEVSGHANYLQEGSTSQHNIAAVVAGLPDPWSGDGAGIRRPRAPGDRVLRPGPTRTYSGLMVASKAATVAEYH